MDDLPDLAIRKRLHLPISRFHWCVRSLAKFMSDFKSSCKRHQERCWSKFRKDSIERSMIKSCFQFVNLQVRSFVLLLLVSKAICEKSNTTNTTMEYIFRAYYRKWTWKRVGDVSASFLSYTEFLKLRMLRRSQRGWCRVRSTPCSTHN